MTIDAQPIDYTEVIADLDVGRPLEVCTKSYEDAPDAVFKMCKIGDFTFRILAMDDGDVVGPPVQAVGSGEQSDNVDPDHIFVTGRKLFIANYSLCRPAEKAYSLGILRYVNTNLRPLPAKVRAGAFLPDED